MGIKKLLAVFLILLASAACINTNVHNDLYTGKIPGTVESYQMADGIYYPLELTSAGMEIFYKEWKAEFGDKDFKVNRALNQIRILWIDTGTFFNNCDPYELYGQVDDDKNIVEISVRKADKSIAATSLAHELTHVANFAVNGKYDYDHNDGKKWSGWDDKHDAVIVIVNNRLRELELQKD